MTDDAAAETARIHQALSGARARLAEQDEAILQSQIAISRIAAPTGDEAERGRFVASRFAALGLEHLRTDAAGNVIGRRPGENGDGEPPVVVCSHLDTVFPRETELLVRRDGSRIVGPGIGDNCRGLAVMLAIAEVIDGVRLRTRRPIEFVATTCEEGHGDLRGAKHYFAGGTPGASAVVALDGAGDERIVHRALGSQRWRIAFEGPGGHSWAAWGVANAVHSAAGAAARLTAIPLPREPRTTLTVSRIGGGLSINAIPAAAWLEVDMRSTDAGALARLQRELRACVHAAAEEENGRRATGTAPIAVTLERIGDRPSGETPESHPLVLAAMAATRLIGRDPELSIASTDANVPISQGIPAVAIGAGGRGGDTHTPNEWYENTDGTLGVARALTLLVAAAGLPARA